MKKFIYIILFAVSASMAVTACTEEEVKPGHTENGGGAGDTGKL